MNGAFLRVSGVESSGKLNFLLAKLSLVKCIFDFFFPLYSFLGVKLITGSKYFTFPGFQRFE